MKLVQSSDPVVTAIAADPEPSDRCATAGRGRARLGAGRPRRDRAPALRAVERSQLGDAAADLDLDHVRVGPRIRGREAASIRVLSP